MRALTLMWTPDMMCRRDALLIVPLDRPSRRLHREAQAPRLAATRAPDVPCSERVPHAARAAVMLSVESVASASCSARFASAAPGTPAAPSRRLQAKRALHAATALCAAQETRGTDHPPSPWQGALGAVPST